MRPIKNTGEHSSPSQMPTGGFQFTSFVELKKLFEIEKAGPNTYFVEPSADFEIANILGMYFECQSID
jgi:hypothetical protein